MELKMIDFIFQAFGKMGYTHPLHPPITHLPVGLVAATFIFALVALLFRRTILPSLSYDRIILLAFIFAFPTIFLGYADWQHHYYGAWLHPIKVKLVLSGVFLILLFVGLIYGRKAGGESKGALAIYALCFLSVTGLGFYGAQLSLEEKPVAPTEAVNRFQAGEELFATNCSSCHSQKSDIFTSPQFVNLSTFLAFIRNPVGPTGTPINMPPFLADKITDDQGLKLHQYLVTMRAINVLNPSGK
jgi:mono/diheme cytochrome c family protein